MLLMREFIEFLEENDTITSLIKEYNIDDAESITHIKDIIKKSIDVEILSENIDILGSFYEKHKDHNERKSLGEFYTPSFIVSYILDAVGYKSIDLIEDLSIIDLSCGSGSFIIESVRRLIERWKKHPCH